MLGPFIGQPACTRIKLGYGVCGTAAEKRESVLVPDVNQFLGHIVCDSSSNSEIVIPMIKNDVLYGVLDIDSPEFSRFTEEDQIELEKLLNVLINNSNMDSLHSYYKF